MLTSVTHIFHSRLDLNSTRVNKHEIHDGQTACVLDSLASLTEFKWSAFFKECKPEFQDLDWLFVMEELVDSF